jgi:hypothetical protein
MIAWPLPDGKRRQNALSGIWFRHRSAIFQSVAKITLTRCLSTTFSRLPRPNRIDRVLRGVLTWRYLSAQSGGAKVMLKNRFTSAAQRAAIEAGIVRNRKASNSERVVHYS